MSDDESDWMRGWREGCAEVGIPRHYLTQPPPFGDSPFARGYRQGIVCRDRAQAMAAAEAKEAPWLR